jgi:tripartite-type tricarboxylate transporter receptor subunit TctC
MYKTFFSRLLMASMALILGAGVTVAQAQAPQWPTRPVKFIVPFAAGAGADIGARVAAEYLSVKWGQPVIVENRPGGDGLIAIRAVVNANDDHQLFFSASGTFTPHPYRHDNLGYDRKRDLIPIARFSNTIVVIGVASTLPAKSLREMVALAKASPRKLNVVLVPGITELVWDGFSKTEGVEITKVPFSNIMQGAAEMETGRIEISMAGLALLQPVLQSKGARLLAVTSRARVASLPDVPTAIEAGVPSLTLEGLVGVFAPSSFNPALRKRVGEEIADVARMPAVAERLSATGQVPNPGGAEEFAADIALQEEQIAKIAEITGLPRRN